MALYQLTAHELHEMLLKKEVSAQEITTAVFKRIEQVEPKVKAYLTLNKEKALEAAAQVDKQIAAGEEIAPLAGIPVAIKDNICTEGLRTTCASKMLADFVPPYNATVMEKLNKNAAITVGKTNMDEFAMGSSTENSAFHPTYNPWNTERVPGGSSGGSAAAVAADECIFALGSDTAGSIRQPAAFCGVVGMKPTYGAVSRYGVVAYSSSMDQVGPITKDVTDMALVLNAICGHDPLDATSVKFDVPDYTKYLVSDVKGMKIGVPKEYMAAGLDSGVRQVIEEAIVKFNELGAVVEEISLPHTKYSTPVSYLIATADASSNLACFDGVRYGYRDSEANDVVEMFTKSRSKGFGPEVKRRILMGTYVLSAECYDKYYLKAQKVRTLIKQDFERVFEKYDLILSPTSPTTAFKIGEKCADPVKMIYQDILTVSVNLAGLPGISLPAGFSDGLPVGLQLIGKPFSEGKLLRAAYTFEQNTDFNRQRPAL